MNTQAFSHWVSSVISTRGLKLTDLSVDFRDGTLLANFLEASEQSKKKKKKREKLSAANAAARTHDSC